MLQADLHNEPAALLLGTRCRRRRDACHHLANMLGLQKKQRESFCKKE